MLKYVTLASPTPQTLPRIFVLFQHAVKRYGINVPTRFQLFSRAKGIAACNLKRDYMLVYSYAETGFGKVGVYLCGKPLTPENNYFEVEIHDKRVQGSDNKRATHIF